MALAWDERLQNALVAEYGDAQANALKQKYGSAFPASYLDDYPNVIIVDDIKSIEQLTDSNPLMIRIYHLPEEDENIYHVRLLTWNKSVSLSDILPILNNFSLRTDSENFHTINLTYNTTVSVNDYIVEYTEGALNIEATQNLFIEALQNTYFGKYSSDGFNKLVLSASLSSREIRVLRTYAKYLHQVGFRFSQSYIESALFNHPTITKKLIELFMVMHDPNNSIKNNTIEQIEQQILQSLESVSSLDEDKIFNRMLDLIKATLRTNYFQTLDDGTPLDYLSMKFSSRDIPELPLPMPLYEIFIYSSRFEGIHLRNTKVARGGIRWSDRHEDFRTEILGLMKAQVVKNAVIVPSGSKGGFVLKKIPLHATREIIQKEVVECYKSFIHGLLSITDNIIDKKPVHPHNVVCRDDFDPYLVVAADKGTASFSDIANGISKEYNFWLDDAFASGGSAGYDHKKMGITARGAWESIKRHFRELDTNLATSNITVIGIGDMSGDVFGNGMLYSRHLKLIAAFDHRHIFLDPNPDPESSYLERLRLFRLPTSSWEDYNPELISKGGGVYNRSLKSIPISDEMRVALGIEDTSLATNDLIRAILKAPVDLFYNGGIGTYVKATNEHQADVGDRTNDYCRVNGNELRCKVVGEGGNLGFTQLGRIEYALNGGLINTDSIDNSAGVNCSDHEVNLKILLDAEIENGNLPADQRNGLLASLTDEVANLVLFDNYSQALVLSFSAHGVKSNMGLYGNFIRELESLNILNRRVEFLPDDKTLLERAAAGEGLTRPELSVLLAYSKIHLKQEILESALPEDPYLSAIVESAFPASIREKYKTAMNNHRLKRDIIATQLSNLIVNEMGITFVYRLQVETGANAEEIVRAYTIASTIFRTKELQNIIEQMDFKIPVPDQYDMLHNIRRLINHSTRWFLHSNHIKEDLQTLISHYSDRIKILENVIPKLMGGFTKEYLASLTEKFDKANLPTEAARRIATSRAIYTSLNIIEVATNNQFDLEKTAQVYFAGGEKINLVWFRDQIASDSREGHWNTLARLTLRDELDISQRALTVVIILSDTNESDTEKLISKWVENNKRSIDRWNKLLEMLHSSNQIDYTMFFIAIRELLGLILRSEGNAISIM